MANLPALPTPGQKPWSLNPHITAMNAELNTIQTSLNGKAPTANAQFSGTIALPGGAAGNPRLPVNGSVTMDGSALGTVKSDKVAYALSATFKGGFSGEAGMGLANPAFIFGHNFFSVSGKTAGDLAGIADIYGVLAEFHMYTPDTTLNKLYGFSAEAAIEPTATGSVVGDLMTAFIKGPIVSPGTTANQVATLRFEEPDVRSGGTVAAGGLRVGLWGRGSALFEGRVPSGQTSRKGVWVGGGGASGGQPQITLAGGSYAFSLDLTTDNVVRFMKTGVEQLASLDSAGIFRLTKTGNRIEAGRFHTPGMKLESNAPVPDANVDTAQAAIWFDATATAPKIMFKAKDANGVVRVGSVALT